MPLILVVAPMAPLFAAGVAGLAALIAAPISIATELLIRAWREPSSQALSEEQRASLERQNALLEERRTAAVTIAGTTLQRAAQAAEERDALMDEQRDAASLLLESTKQIAHAATTLAAVDSRGHERNAFFNTAIAHQMTQLADTVQSVPTNMALLSRELEEKQHLIESLRLQLAALQAESAAREATLQQIVSQVAELAALNQDQAAIIETLQNQKAVLLDNMKALTEELELLTSAPIDSEYLPTNAVAPKFFS